MKYDIVSAYSFLKEYIKHLLRRNNNCYKIFESNLSDVKKPVVWVHVNSVAELEYALPIIKLFVKECKYTFLVTYTSSIQLGLQRDHEYIDYQFALPKNYNLKVESFISFIKPSVAIFTTLNNCSKYLAQLQKVKIPTFLITDKSKIIYQGFNLGGFSHRDKLDAFTRIFVINKDSKALIDKIERKNVTHINYLPLCELSSKGVQNYGKTILERFAANNNFIFIGGNIETDNDLRLVTSLANKNRTLKCILVPHTISEEHLNKFKYELEGYTMLYSECNQNTDFSEVQVLVIDYLGALSYIYHYGSCAFIGGSKPCLENIIEATALGLPTSFGPHYKNKSFPKLLINNKISQTVKTSEDIYKWEKNLESAPVNLQKININAKQIVQNGLKSTTQIYTYINRYL